MNRINHNGQELYARRFNTGDDLKGQSFDLTILKIEPVKVWNNSKEVEKYAIHFQDCKRPFLLGKQFAESIAQALNEWNTANWTGQTITIYPVPSKRGGHTILARAVQPKEATP